MNRVPDFIRFSCRGTVVVASKRSIEHDGRRNVLVALVENHFNGTAPALLDNEAIFIDINPSTFHQVLDVLRGDKPANENKALKNALQFLQIEGKEDDDAVRPEYNEARQRFFEAAENNKGEHLFAQFPFYQSQNLYM